MKTGIDFPPAVSLRSLGVEAETVSDRLRTDLGALLGTLPTTSSTALSRLLGLSQPLCHRIVGASSTPCRPAEFFGRLPGVQGLEGFILACERRGLAPSDLRAARQAVEAYRRLALAAGGSQRRLVAVLSAQGGAGPEFDARRLAYEASVALYRSRTQCLINVALYRPDLEEPSRLASYGVLVRAGVERKAGSMPLVAHFNPHASQGERRIDHPAEARLEREFQSANVTKAVRREASGAASYLYDAPLEEGGPFDILAGPFASADTPRPGVGADATFLTSAFVRTPTRWLLKDSWLHRSLVGSLAPRSGAYLIAGQGPVQPPVESRWYDRFPDSVDVLLLGTGFDQTAFGAYPRMTELSRRVFEESGWNPSEFVGFRIAVPFPVLQIEYLLAFECPTSRARPEDDPLEAGSLPIVPCGGG